MRRRFKLEPLLHVLLASVALSPAACGGSSESTKPDGTGGSTSVTLGACDNPITSDASGWVRCSADFYGFSHRESSGMCNPFVPRTDPIAGCSDADCADLLYGHCWSPGTSGLASTASCIPGCVSDADCAAGEVCFCEEPVGRCLPADCTIDENCGPNAFCSTYMGPDMPACGFYVAGVACQTKSDACVGDECTCAMVGGDRQCLQGLGGCGRPFLVEGAERTAQATPRDDWSLPSGAATRLHLPSARERALLAEHWTRSGLLEHASIAAFARFSLELLALGAPPELVADAARAMSDETRHAELCFSLASAYAESPVGPGPLAVADCLESVTLAAVVTRALLEGCIGETVAAAEARELARTARDPNVQSALELVASDETRHAALAFRFVRWALERGDARIAALVRTTLADELERARGVEPTDDGGEALLALGLPSPGFRAALRRDVLESVVSPCLDALVRETRGTRPPSVDPSTRRVAVA